MEPFETRHLGPDDAARATMLQRLGISDLDALTNAALPDDIRMDEPLALAPALTEAQVQAELTRLAEANNPGRAMIGLGYHGTLTPAVIRRGILENPAWYTAYTPYQPEISQGRLEALLNFQTMVADLTGMMVANASMLDEATAAAEAMTLMLRATKNKPRRLIVDAEVFPQTRAVIETRAEPLGIDVVVVALDFTADGAGLPPGDFYGVITQ
ncbi:MAG: glycine dehydrogenase (aminomethyl-transferring), partial [Propioniciclava sp.]